MIFTVCLTGLLLQIYEKKNPKIFLMGAVGYIFIGLSSIFVYIPSKTLLLYELLNLNSGAQVLFSTAFIFAMLPIGYTLLTIASNKAGILDNVVSIGLAIIFVVNFMPYLIVPRILFGLAITILGYLSLQNL
jgi:hypothetical protein